MKNETYVEKLCDMIKKCNDRGIRVIAKEGMIYFYDAIEYSNFIKENHAHTRNDDQLNEIDYITL